MSVLLDVIKTRPLCHREPVQNCETIQVQLKKSRLFPDHLQIIHNLVKLVQDEIVFLHAADNHASDHKDIPLVLHPECSAESLLQSIHWRLLNRILVGHDLLRKFSCCLLLNGNYVFLINGYGVRF